MADTGFRGGVGVGGVAEPSAFFSETFESACPLGEEFVDVIGAHLIDDEKYDELGLGGGWGRLRSRRAQRWGLGRGSLHQQDAASEKYRRRKRLALQKGTLPPECFRKHSQDRLPNPSKSLLRPHNSAVIADCIDRGAVRDDTIPRPCASLKKHN